MYGWKDQVLGDFGLRLGKSRGECLQRRRAVGCARIVLSVVISIELRRWVLEGLTSSLRLPNADSAGGCLGEAMCNGCGVSTSPDFPGFYHN